MSFDTFLLSFVPLFVAIDVFGTLPLFASLTGHLSEERRKRLILQALATSFAVSLGFLFAGRALFTFLGITENDFRIAGGLVLLIVAITDLVSSGDKDPGRDPGHEIGVVPIGIPLIMGPAALTSILISNDSFGIQLTALSLVCNLFIVWIVFSQSKALSRFMGASGSKAFAKVASLFLAAIAIMMIRVGVENIVRGS